MSSVCISNYVDDARIPVRATYHNLYSWPESDADFMKTTLVGSNQHRRGRPRVVDSISCRQLYLRIYTFSRKETVPERTKKCLDRVKEKVVARRRRKRKGVGGGRGRRRWVMVLRRVKAVSRTAVSAVFQREGEMFLADKIQRRKKASMDKYAPISIDLMLLLVRSASRTIAFAVAVLCFIFCFCQNDLVFVLVFCFCFCFCCCRLRTILCFVFVVYFSILCFVSCFSVVDRLCFVLRRSPLLRLCFVQSLLLPLCRSVYLWICPNPLPIVASAPL